MGQMGLFKRKSRWDEVLESVATVASSGGIRRLSKVTLAAVGGAVAATAASAAVSAVRRQEQK
jgi:hypothetical protein